MAEKKDSKESKKAAQASGGWSEEKVPAVFIPLMEEICSMWDSGAPVNDILDVNQSASGRISSINTMKYQHLESHLRPSHFLIIFFDLGHSGLESKAILKGIFYFRYL